MNFRSRRCLPAVFAVSVLALLATVLWPAATSAAQSAVPVNVGEPLVMAGATPVIDAPLQPGPPATGAPAPGGLSETQPWDGTIDTPLPAAEDWSAAPAPLPSPLTQGGFTPQIVGGSTATQVPAASIALILFNKDGDNFSCTGTLVAPQWVLTAGHCLVKYSAGNPVRVPNDPDGYSVYVGSSAAGTQRLVDQVKLNDGYLLRTSSEDVPGYRDSLGAWQRGQANVANETGLDDFGLLHLTSAPPAATPVPLAVDDMLAQTGRTVWAAGWGVTSGAGGSLPATLQEASMTIANSTYCEIAWHKYFSATSSTCYVGTTAATCNGDSGGPVMSQDEKGKWWLVAVISGGPNGCPVNQPYVGVRSQWAAPFVASVTGVAQPGRSGESFTPVVPTRIIDSRNGEGVSFIPPTIEDPASQGVFLPRPMLPTNFVTRRPIFGANGVAGLPIGGVSGVVLNVTVEGAPAGGFVAVYPCTDGWNGTSNVNFSQGQTVANLVVSKVDRNGDICVLAAAQTAVIVDLTGWLGPQGNDRMTDSADPVRIFDSREAPNQKLGNGATAVVAVTGAGRAPVGAKAAVLNVTSTDAEANGFVTAYPCDAPRPLASNLNPVRGRDIPNSVMVQLDGQGRVCLYSELATHLVVDLNGWVIEGGPGTVKTVAPSRLVDTRPNGVRISANSPLIVKVTGVGGVPSTDIDSVLLNVTVTEPAAAGYLVVYPCGPVPYVSNLNFVQNQTVPNAVMAKVDGSGNVCILSVAPTHVLVDLTGYVRT